MIRKASLSYSELSDMLLHSFYIHLRCRLLNYSIIDPVVALYEPLNREEDI